MRIPARFLPPSVAAFLVAMAFPAAARAANWASHPPMRPLPAASDRPMAAGPARFVDASKGDDSADGSEPRPWRTVARAARDLKPGDTLYLRGGIYREALSLSLQGTPAKPITIRAHPGELVVVDRGLPEFYDDPARAWVPFPGGAEGEFVSAKAYPEIQPRGEASTNVEGNFGDSMVPLHGSKFIDDLRSNNPYWSGGEEDDGAPKPPAEADAKKAKATKGVQVYCGPGVWFDAETRKIHARLAHTRLKGLEADGANYKGETDPRKLRLVIAARGRPIPLTLANSRHVRIEDLVLRGGLEAEISMEYCVDVTFDGVTAYGGAMVMNVKNTVGLRLLNVAFRGCSAPWVFRSHLKYRAIESSLMKCGGWAGAGNRDFEIAWSEFTDTIDGLFLGPVNGVRFHHNLVENFSDDCIFVTAPTLGDGRVLGGNIVVSQNYFGRILTTFSYGVGHGRQRLLPGEKRAFQTGAGVWACRNVFDFRKWVYYQLPKGPNAEQDFTDMGRLGGDHGSPAWEPMFFYQNTVIAGDTARGNPYGSGLGKAGMGHGTTRCLFNNIFANAKGMPGMVLPDGGARLKADGNLHWSFAEGAGIPEADFFARFRASKAFEQSKGIYAPGWTTHDRFANPGFMRFDPKPEAPLDLRLQADSPAVKAGVPLPPECPDPLLVGQGAGPDVGALPFNAEPWRVGVRGRYTMFGRLADSTVTTALQEPGVKATPEELAPWRAAALVEGYPAFEARHLEYALEQQHYAVDVYDRQWLAGADFAKYSLVAYNGELAHAGATTTTFSEQDLARLKPWLEGGGTLLMTGRTLWAFRGAGAAFLSSIGFREAPRKGGAPFEPVVLKPDHAWLGHMEGETNPPWLRDKKTFPVEFEKAENVIGDKAGRSILCRVAVGKGQVIYVGWGIPLLSDSRKPGKLQQDDRLLEERSFENQVRILMNIVGDAARNPAR